MAGFEPPASTVQVISSVSLTTEPRGTNTKDQIIIDIYRNIMHIVLNALHSAIIKQITKFLTTATVISSFYQFICEAVEKALMKSEFSLF